MLGLQLLLLLALLAICTFAPGFVLTCRLRLAPLERLCVSLGLSLVLLYLASSVIWIFRGGRPWCVAVSLACLVLAIADARRIVEFLRSPRVRRGVACFALLFLWALAALALVRHYGGGGWYGDWFEHYQRTQVFLGRIPETTTLLGGYALPARPPLTNVVAAFFLAQIGDRFELFQVCFLLLNLLTFFPCYLLACAMAPRRRGLAFTLVALLALNPFFLQNATYTWTKLLATFFVILAAALYVRGWRKSDPTRTALAFVSLAAGALAHYMVGPYIVFFIGHTLWRMSRHRNVGWRPLIVAAALSATLLATWFGWSLVRFGPAKTLLSNTAVTDLEEKSVSGNIARIASNLLATVLPHPLRGVSLSDFAGSSRLGFLRDWSFLIYQTNIIVAMGIVGGFLAVFLLYRAVRSGTLGWQRSEARFWLAFIATAFILGVSVVASKDEMGLAHVCLVPLVLLGVTLIAARYANLAPVLRVVAAIGLATDFALGIALHLGLENVDFSEFAQVQTAGDANLRPLVLSAPAFANWRLKEDFQLVFFGDHFAGVAVVMEGLMAAGAVLLILWLTLPKRAERVRRPAACQSPTSTT